MRLGAHSRRARLPSGNIYLARECASTGGFYTIGNEIFYRIKNQNVLEAACGRAEFAICASTYAKSVHCIDLTDSRLLPEASEHTNLFFQRMDAAKMDYPSASFDTVVLYNTIAHLGPALEQVVEECLRVLRSGGTLLIISSFKMDKNVIREELIPLLKRKKIEWKDGEISAFYYMAVISC